jgi:hypothetical protein
VKLATNKDLARWLKLFNGRFFDGRIDPAVQVRFALSEEDQCDLGDDCDAVYLPDEQLILIEKTFRSYERVTQILLLHEMIHAEFPDHVSQPFSDDHGMIFQHRVVTLFNLGAYDGLL